MGSFRSRRMVAAAPKVDPPKVDPPKVDPPKEAPKAAKDPESVLSPMWITTVIRGGQPSTKSFPIPDEPKKDEPKKK